MPLKLKLPGGDSGKRGKSTASAKSSQANSTKSSASPASSSNHSAAAASSPEVHRGGRHPASGAKHGRHQQQPHHHHQQQQAHQHQHHHHQHQHQHHAHPSATGPGGPCSPGHSEPAAAPAKGSPLGLAVRDDGDRRNNNNNGGSPKSAPVVLAASGPGSPRPDGMMIRRPKSVSAPPLPPDDASAGSPAGASGKAKEAKPGRNRAYSVSRSGKFKETRRRTSMLEIQDRFDKAAKGEGGLGPDTS